MPVSANTTSSEQYHVERYGNTRNWALRDGGDLLAVTVYRKGAEAVQAALEARDTVIAEQAARLEQLLTARMEAQERPTPGATRFQDRVQNGQAKQRGLFSRQQSIPNRAGR